MRSKEILFVIASNWSNPFVKHYISMIASAMMQTKTKKVQTGRKEAEWSIFSDGMIIFVENLLASKKKYYS